MQSNIFPAERIHIASTIQSSPFHRFFTLDVNICMLNPKIRTTFVVVMLIDLPEYDFLFWFIFLPIFQTAGTHINVNREELSINSFYLFTYKLVIWKVFVIIVILELLIKHRLQCISIIADHYSIKIFNNSIFCVFFFFWKMWTIPLKNLV